METILVYGAKPENIRELIKEVGNKIGAVHFLKRKDGSLRKMAYHLHVSKNKQLKSGFNSSFDIKNKQIRVFDYNKIIHGIDGSKKRGAYRMIPLENVIRIAINKKVYLIKR